MDTAVKYYDSISKRAIARGIVIDIFVASIDQSGIYEMKSLFEKTGGYYIMTDSFQNPVFKESYNKFFTIDEAGNLKMGFMGKIQVYTSKEFKISGCIGHVSPIEGKKTPQVSENIIGIGGTTAWNLGGIDKNTSLAFYFDIVNKVSQAGAHPPVYI